MIYANLSNPNRHDLNPVSVCFPIEDYKMNYEKLAVVGIGKAAERDCYVAEIYGGCPALKILEATKINVDELDYLAKRLESFCTQRELVQFQGFVVSHSYVDMTDLINLTFCCRKATVVQDFSDLESVGREHYMNIHGGVTAEEMESIDFKKIGQSLILNGDGKITPYGAVYDNGMHLEQLYDGCHFPHYRYSGDTVMTVAVTNRKIAEELSKITWLYLPGESCQIERALYCAGIDDPKDMGFECTDSELPAELTGVLTGEENLYKINSLCHSFQQLDCGERQKLEAVLQMIAPADLTQVQNLIKQLDLFDFIPGISNPEEYGRYMIMESGHFRYDGELDGFYDYKKYGEWRVANERGKFISSGYVSGHGFVSIEEILAGVETEHMEMTMGGM